MANVTTPRTRAEQKRHTRALIVEAGRNGVATRGFTGLVVRELAREVGIVPTRDLRTGEVDSTPDCHVQICVNAPVGDVEIEL